MDSDDDNQSPTTANTKDNTENIHSENMEQNPMTTQTRQKTKRAIINMKKAIKQLQTKWTETTQRTLTRQQPAQP